jgi:hypothetical protein
MIEGSILGSLGGQGCFMLLGTDGLQALAAGMGALRFGLGNEMCLDAGPLLRPAVIANEVAQGKHGVDMAALPVHAGAFEACFDDRLVGAFDHAAADGPTLLAEVWIA